jgi:hypothetical protein
MELPGVGRDCRINIAEMSKTCYAVIGCFLEGLFEIEKVVVRAVTMWYV